MSAVRFLYTSQPGKGFDEFINPDEQLKNWLKDGLRQPHSGSYTRTLDKGLSVSVQDGWVICTCLTRQTDDNGRPFIRNHSVLVPEAEYNSLAVDFDRTIMAHIEEGDEAALIDGKLKPLNIPEEIGNGLQGEDMKALADDFGPDLEKLLATLVAEKSFSITKRGTTDDAIYLACTLLKTAALHGLPVPQFSTFEPNSKTRSWYASQISIDSRQRGSVQFQQRGPLDDDAIGTARRLAPSFVNSDPDGPASSMRTANNHAEVMSYSPPAAVSPPAARASRPPRKVEAPAPESSDPQIYQINKEYEAALNNRKEEHDREFDARQKELDKLKQELDARQEDLDHRRRTQQDDIDRQKRELSDKERTLEEERALVAAAGAKRARWRQIEEIFRVLENSHYPDPEHQVLSRFFDQLKNLNTETLQVLQSDFKDFIPELQKIAESDEAGKSTFLKDLESIEKKLEGKGSRWGLPRF